MKPNLKIICSTLIILITIFFLTIYVTTHISDFKTLSNIGLSNFYFIFLIFIFNITFIILNGLYLDILMKPFGLKLKQRESFGLSVVTNFYNTITPFKGGMAARAVYLKKKYNFSYLHFFAIFSAVYLLVFLISAITGLISMIYLYLVYGLFDQIIFFIFLGIFIFMLLIIIFSPKFNENKNKWINRVIKVINGWHLIKNNKKTIFITVLISLIQLILGTLSTIITYSIFGVEIDFFKALFIASIGSLSILISITPGNLGIGDAINVFSATIVGIGTTEAVAATVLGRVIGLIVILILGPIFSYILMKDINKKEIKEIKEEVKNEANN